VYTAEQCYELALLALCIYWEARGEGSNGQHAVAWVIKNRVTRGGWFGKSWAEVILKPYQFSSFNANDKQKFPIPETDPAFGPCLYAAKHVYDGTSPDPTMGATHYYASSGPSKIDPPSWVKDMIPTVTTGNQSFFRQK
jgi:spore germination cell wall hydrolase CwlJ-like protein